MKLGFATDIHLDHIKDVKGQAKHRRVGAHIAEGLDALVVGGDISTGEHFQQQFGAFCEGAGIPVYFVLGNHDFWDAPESVVRSTAASFPGNLDTVGIVELTPTVALMGRTGWYDTLSGNPRESNWAPNDWKRTSRLIDVWRVPDLLYKACQTWAEEETEKAVAVLEVAAQCYSDVIFVTHFPCFPEACFAPEGGLDARENGFWPWSINTTMGHAIREVIDRYPNTAFTMLTGHTHGAGRAQVSPNLTCIAGKARYGHPQLAGSWVV